MNRAMHITCLYLSTCVCVGGFCDKELWSGSRGSHSSTDLIDDDDDDDDDERTVDQRVLFWNLEALWSRYGTLGSFCVCVCMWWLSFYAYFLLYVHCGWVQHIASRILHGV